MRPTHGIGIAAAVAGVAGTVTAPAKRLPRREMALGAVFGLAWAASMRGMMAVVAATGGQSHVSAATFIFILLPGTLMGALMAWALVPPRPGMVPAPERLKWAPLVMCFDPAALPLMLAVVGAGWVAGGRGTPKSRLWIGIPSALMLLALPVAMLASPPTGWGSWRESWLLLLATSLLGSLTIVESMVVRKLASEG